jgi:mevalonate kinase
MGDLIQVTASAPGKVILFGEHAVVYGKPAIAVAVNRLAHVTLTDRTDSHVRAELNGLGVVGFLDLENETIESPGNQLSKGMLKYILKALKVIKGRTEFNQSGTESIKTGLDVTVDIEMPVASGLGSSAAVTVATLAAAGKYHGLDLEAEEIASLAHQVELEVQGAASPIDTTLSTHGGAIYLSRDARELVKLPIDWELPLVIAHTKREGNTGELVGSVRCKLETYPSIINPLLDSIEEVTDEAQRVLLSRDDKRLGELMNINHGLLDALGVNTQELSRMVYLARQSGALGSKITGAGGGGSIIAYCPGKMGEVLHELESVEQAFPVELYNKGVTCKVME